MTTALGEQRLLLPTFTDDETDTLNRLLAELKAKNPRNLLRASYYLSLIHI